MALQSPSEGMCPLTSASHWTSSSPKEPQLLSAAPSSCGLGGLEGESRHQEPCPPLLSSWTQAEHCFLCHEETPGAWGTDCASANHTKDKFILHSQSTLQIWRDIHNGKNGQVCTKLLSQDRDSCSQGTK